MIAGLQLSYGQERQKHQVKIKVVDDHQEGYSLLTYLVPEDGFYTFSLLGGFQPGRSSTIYYCEYELQLHSDEKVYRQDHYNIASQAQDGDVCYFHENAKNNSVSGVFRKNDKVEVRLQMTKSDINGQPHKKVRLLSDTQVEVQLMRPAYTSN